MQLLPIIFAPFIGSFAGVLIQRLPADRPVALADKVARVAQAVTAMGERYRGIRSRFARVLAPG